MKKIIFLLLSVITVQGFAQEEKKEEIKKWTVGFGINFIDNTSTYNDQYLNVSKQWNSIQTISKVSVERSITNLFSAEAALTVNKLSKDKLQNGEKIISDVNYISLDVSGKFYFDEFIVKKSKFDTYVILGAGLNSADSVFNQTANYGLGFNYWLEPNLGLRFQTIGKYGIEQQTLCNNHIQHSAELIFKF
jgi:OOP family OmpA-OmpF porin